MRIRVKLFAVLRDRANTSDLTIDLDNDRATVAQARDAVASQLPALRELMPRVAFAVNQEYVKPDAPLRDDDELALIPPVSGG
jgi:molybdopterin converting factor subunit 1